MQLPHSLDTNRYRHRRITFHAGKGGVGSGHQEAIYLRGKIGRHCDGGGQPVDDHEMQRRSQRQNRGLGQVSRGQRMRRNNASRTRGKNAEYEIKQHNLSQSIYLPVILYETWPRDPIPRWKARLLPCSCFLLPIPASGLGLETVSKQMALNKRHETASTSTVSRVGWVRNLTS